ncbi:MAG: hypothetical protein U1E42_11790 [Rhodospirillales bacterium]
MNSGSRRATLSLVMVLMVAFLVAGTIRQAAAQAAGEWVATVRGESRAPLPPHSTLTVTAEDADDLSMRLQSVIEQGLRATGYGVGDDGSGLQLWFDTELSRATADPGLARPENATEVGALPVDEEMFGSDGDDSDDVADVEVLPRANVPFGAKGKAAGTPYSLTFIVGRPGETPIWQGSMRTRIGAADPFDVAQAMVPVLIGQLGKSVDGEMSFP